MGLDTWRKKLPYLLNQKMKSIICLGEHACGVSPEDTPYICVKTHKKIKS